MMGIVEWLRKEAEIVALDRLDEAADEIERLRVAASLALHEMRHTVAPRNSFTDAVDALDAALNHSVPADKEQR